jgi:hypothetical protein
MTPIQHPKLPALINPHIPRPEVPPPFAERNKWTSEPWAWFPFKNFESRPENSTEYERPWHVGVLWRRTNEALLAMTFENKEPRPFASWHWYLCRVCGRSYSQRRAPHMIRLTHCGCLQAKQIEDQPVRRGANAQTVRYEGQVFGRLTVVDYELLAGWQCLCECGVVEYVPSTRLQRHAVTACRECHPWQYDGRPGKRATWDMRCSCCQDMAGGQSTSRAS